MGCRGSARQAGRLRHHVAADVESAWQLFQNIVVPVEPDPDAAARAIAYGNKPGDVDKLIEAEVFGPARRRAAVQAKRSPAVGSSVPWPATPKRSTTS